MRFHSSLFYAFFDEIFARTMHAIHRKYCYTAYLLLILSLCFTACTKDIAQPAAIISAFTPTEGFAGSTVTISGENFSIDASLNLVKFGNQTAEVVSASSKSLTVIVPEGANTGNITISVGNLSTESEQQFIVLQPASISSFMPSSGIVGDIIAIQGSNFSPVPGENHVLINGSPATVAAASSSVLSVEVPAAATTGKIVVSVKDRSATSATNFTVLVPSITAFSPQIGSTHATVIINGANFSSNPGLNQVRFSGIPATITAATANQLTVTVPAGAVTGQISVTVGSASTNSTAEYEVCNNYAELVLSDIVINSVAPDGRSFSFSFKVTNVGAVTADLSGMILQNYASADNAYQQGDLPVGGFRLSLGGTLETGQSYQTGWTSSFPVNNTSATVTTHPYLILYLYQDPLGAVMECNTANNVVAKKIQE